MQPPVVHTRPVAHSIDLEPDTDDDMSDGMNAMNLMEQPDPRVRQSPLKKHKVQIQPIISLTSTQSQMSTGQAPGSSSTQHSTSSGQVPGSTSSTSNQQPQAADAKTGGGATKIVQPFGSSEKGEGDDVEGMRNGIMHAVIKNALDQKKKACERLRVDPARI